MILSAQRAGQVMSRSRLMPSRKADCSGPWVAAPHPQEPWVSSALGGSTPVFGFPSDNNVRHAEAKCTVISA